MEQSTDLFADDADVYDPDADSYIDGYATGTFARATGYPQLEYYFVMAAVVGSGLHYLVTVVLLEMWSLGRYASGYFLGGDDPAIACKRLMSMQIFVLGGVAAYRELMLSSPRGWSRLFQQMYTFEWLFLVALTTPGGAGLEGKEGVIIFLGARVAGFVYAAVVTGLLRLLGLARIERGVEPEEPEEPAEPAAAAQQQQPEGTKEE